MSNDQTKMNVVNNDATDVANAGNGSEQTSEHIAAIEPIEVAGEVATVATTEIATATLDESTPDQATEEPSLPATTNAFAVDVVIDIAEAKLALEAALLAASEPMPLQELKKIFDGGLSLDIIRNLLDELRDEWTGRSVELALVASG